VWRYGPAVVLLVGVGEPGCYIVVDVADVLAALIAEADPQDFLERHRTRPKE
jgi:hypothetical protein